MANPLMLVGSKSLNPSGRPKSSARSIRGMCERFLSRTITPHKLSKLYEQLAPKDQAEFIIALMPFTIPRQTPDSISHEEVERLHQILEQDKSV